jgi:hypothetical protein
MLDAIKECAFPVAFLGFVVWAVAAAALEELRPPKR